MSKTLAALITDKRGDLPDQEVAKRIGVNQSIISRWRRGAGWPTPRNYKPLAKWLGISVEQLTQMVEAERVAAGIKPSGDGAAARAQVLRLVGPLQASMGELSEQLTALTGRVAHLEHALSQSSARGRPAKRS